MWVDPSDLGLTEEEEKKRREERFWAFLQEQLPELDFTRFRIFLAHCPEYPILDDSRMSRELHQCLGISDSPRSRIRVARSMGHTDWRDEWNPPRYTSTYCYVLVRGRDQPFPDLPGIEVEKEIVERPAGD